MNELDLDYILKAWLNTLVALEYNGNMSLAMKYWNSFQERYTHADRSWHDLYNLQRILGEIATICDVEGRPRVLKASLYFAAFFQYYHYVPGNNDNAARSAIACWEAGDLFDIGSSEIEFACKAVKNYPSFISQDSSGILYDADLAILAEGPGWYTIYSSAIQLEYYQWTHWHFFNARAEWLKQMIARGYADTLYYSEVCNTTATNLAVMNLEWELSECRRILRELKEDHRDIDDRVVEIVEVPLRAGDTVF